MCRLFSKLMFLLYVIRLSPNQQGFYLQSLVQETVGVVCVYMCIADAFEVNYGVRFQAKTVELFRYNSACQNQCTGTEQSAFH